MTIILAKIQGKTGHFDTELKVFTERAWTTAESLRFEKYQFTHRAKVSTSIVGEEKKAYIERPFLRQYFLFLEALKELDPNVDEEKILINHSNGMCFYKGHNYGLVYPKKWLNLIQKKEKDIDFFFSGYKNLKSPNTREWVFDYESPKSKIFYSDRGRNIPRNYFDNEFFELMSRSKFALCPQGYPHKWTYRFFEATLCRAIPVLIKKDIVPIYSGFKYLIHDENSKKTISLKYFDEIANFNYKLALKKLFIKKII